MENLKKPIVRYLLFGLGVLIILLLTFQGGVYVGMNRGIYSSHWGENYSRNFFPMPRPDLVMGMENRGMMNSHGAFGQIVKLDGQGFVVKGPQEAEKPVIINSQTPISRGFDTINYSDLKVGDNVLVIGSPNDIGQIDAKLIRLLPALPPLP